MPEVYVAIGSNIDPEEHVRTALADLAARFGAIRRSPVYRNPPVGFEGEAFLNLVAGWETAESVDAVMAALAAIEQRHARDRDAPRFSARTLDLDLLLYGDRVDPQRRLPRRDIVEYAFVLKPLAELNPDGVHPELGLSYRALWARHAPAPDLEAVAL